MFLGVAVGVPVVSAWRWRLALACGRCEHTPAGVGVAATIRRWPSATVAVVVMVAAAGARGAGGLHLGPAKEQGSGRTRSRLGWLLWWYGLLSSVVESFFHAHARLRRLAAGRVGAGLRLGQTGTYSLLGGAALRRACGTQRRAPTAATAAPVAIGRTHALGGDGAGGAAARSW